MIGLAGALVALGSFTSSDFIALAVPLIALLGMAAVIRGVGEEPVRPRHGRAPAQPGRREPVGRSCEPAVCARADRRNRQPQLSAGMGRPAGASPARWRSLDRPQPSATARPLPAACAVTGAPPRPRAAPPRAVLRGRSRS